jgi:hypothetical protein
MPELAGSKDQASWRRFQLVLPGVNGFRLELTPHVRLEVQAISGYWYPSVVYGGQTFARTLGLSSAAAAEQWAWREAGRLNDELSKALSEPYQPLAEVAP